MLALYLISLNIINLIFVSNTCLPYVIVLKILWMKMKITIPNFVRLKPINMKKIALLGFCSLLFLVGCEIAPELPQERGKKSISIRSTDDCLTFEGPSVLS